MDYQAWCTEQDIKKKEEERKRKKELKNRRRKEKFRLIRLKQFREEFGDYWYYPNYNIWVPIECWRIVSRDGVNSLSIFEFNFDQVEQSNLMSTLVGGGSDVDLDTYHQLVCEERDGKWYYTGGKK